MDVITDYSLNDNTFVHKSAGIIRTARKLAEGKFLFQIAFGMETSLEDCDS